VNWLLASTPGDRRMPHYWLDEMPAHPRGSSTSQFPARPAMARSILGYACRRRRSPPRSPCAASSCTDVRRCSRERKLYAEIALRSRLRKPGYRRAGNGKRCRIVALVAEPTAPGWGGYGPPQSSTDVGTLATELRSFPCPKSMAGWAGTARRPHRISDFVGFTAPTD